VRTNEIIVYSPDTMQYVEDHIHEKITLQDMADSVHLSVFYFVRKFREESGITPKQYIISRKIAHAGMLLEETDLKVREIADRIGYEAPRFTTLFRTTTGYSPCDYRRMCWCEQTSAMNSPEVYQVESAL